MAAETSLEARIARLEDRHAICELKYRYCNLCDDGYQAAPLAELFLEDAVWDGGALGRFEGRAAIRRFFESCGTLVSFAVHQVTNPILEIDGDRATGLWLLWEPLVFAQGDRALWLGARYHDRYRRVGGAWRFAEVRLETRMLTPYDEGFAKVRIAELPR